MHFEHEKSQDSPNYGDYDENDIEPEICEKLESIKINEDVKPVKLTRKEGKKLAQKEKFDSEHKLTTIDQTMSHFTVSQQTASTRNDLNNDVKVEKLSISAAGKLLLDNADLILSCGHRYGLVGPNGMGKTTLLVNIASRALKMPSNLDILLCEQDIEVDDTPAVTMVINADIKRLNLLAEEQELLKDISKGVKDAVSRLQEVNDELQEIKAGSADSRARRILSVTSDIIHLNDKKLYNYKGNYNSFKKMYDQKFKDQTKQYEQQRKHLKQLKVSGKSTNDAVKAVLAVQKKKAEKAAKPIINQGAGIGGISADQTLLIQPREYVVKFTIPNPSKLNPPIIGLKDVTFGYNNKAEIFKKINFGIDMSSRVAIVGPNGVGKSTLLKMLTGLLTPITGELIKNPRLPNFICSGGQKSRVALCEMTLRSPDDEPTNNLDVESIDALAVAINNFEGGVIIVSHDARLILETNCDLWVVEDQSVNQVEGDFEDYRLEVLESLGETTTKK
ncbi:hypothetical protein MXB_3717 [Myxobolus squamalis]|nr:hypothetical protein MXB_3717 [Myxobolus squamalis]